MLLDDDGPTGTLLGQLQRGLGRGYLHAQQHGLDHEVLLHCILHDPRWDRQVEERASYYAGLALLLQLDVGRMRDAIETDGAPEPRELLAADVLMEMAVRGHARALTALRDGLRSDGWGCALRALSNAEWLHGTRLLTRDDLWLVAGSRPDEVSVLMSDAGYPWRDWATFEPRLQALLDEQTPQDEPAWRPPAPVPDTSMSTADLLRIADPRNAQRVANVLSQRRDARSIEAMMDAAQGEGEAARRVAYRALTVQAHPGLLEHATSLIATEPSTLAVGHRAALVNYLAALPGGHTLPMARDWLHAGGALALAAEHVLARHAQPEDRELVEEVLSQALVDAAVYRACSMVDALGHIGDSQSVDVLVDAFAQIPYAYGRHFVLKALWTCEPRAAEPLATEALWDCQDEVRARGARWAPLSDEAQARLAEMERDPFERDDVRRAASDRLEGSLT